jgi:hypothetical protein
VGRLEEKSVADITFERILHIKVKVADYRCFEPVVEHMKDDKEVNLKIEMIQTLHGGESVEGGMVFVGGGVSIGAGETDWCIEVERASWWMTEIVNRLIVEIRKIASARECGGARWNTIVSGHGSGGRVLHIWCEYKKDMMLEKWDAFGKSIEDKVGEVLQRARRECDIRIESTSFEANREDRGSYMRLRYQWPERIEEMEEWTRPQVHEDRKEERGRFVAFSVPKQQVGIPLRR